MGRGSAPSAPWGGGGGRARGSEARGGGGRFFGGGGGVAFFDGGRQLAVSAGHENRVLLYGIRDGRAALQDSIVVGPRWSAGGQYPQGKSIDYGPRAIWTDRKSVV